MINLFPGSEAAPDREASAPRLLLLAGVDSAVELIEEYGAASSSRGQYFSCGISEIFLEGGAQVRQSPHVYDHKIITHIAE